MPTIDHQILALVLVVIVLTQNLGTTMLALLVLLTDGSTTARFEVIAILLFVAFSDSAPRSPGLHNFVCRMFTFLYFC